MKPLIPILTLLTLVAANPVHLYADSHAAQPRMKILIDTDANNELDDQHALAYAFTNPNTFEVVGVTVNNTFNGNGIQGQYDEALRILTLFNLQDSLPLIKGATGNYEDILPTLNQPDHDGHAAVDFIIEEALKMKNERLILVPVGKLTNVALALQKEPAIIDKVKVVWMGTNYPDPGEYNMINDLSAVNPVIESKVPLEIIPARYGKPTASDAVKVTPGEIMEKMKDRGPRAQSAIIGRNGGTFRHFGNYSINLFQNIELYGDPPARAMFAMVALAVLKNPDWGVASRISAPLLQGEGWKQRIGNRHTIIIWDRFNRDEIINDFFQQMNRASK